MHADLNWALFVESEQINWSFGNPDGEFQTFVTNFLTGLRQIGEEIFGQHGIASIEFDLKRHRGYKPADIFIVSLANKFFLIMSDPPVTMKLIDARGGISQEIQEIMSAVLVGQASLLYSQCISEIEDSEIQELEKIWQNIILDISDDYNEIIDKVVSGSSTNFSLLSFNDLLFLHYYLRKQPELTKPLSPRGWALVSHHSGGEIPLSYNVEERDPVVLAGYLGIIIAFIKTLFASNPKRLIFGTNNIQSLTFINGNEYFIAIDSPFTELMKNNEFYEEFFNLEQKINEDLKVSVHKRIIEEIIAIKTEGLEEKDIKTLLQSFNLTRSKKIYPKKKFERRRFLARIFGRI
jgi:hypothetical protein